MCSRMILSWLGSTLIWVCAGLGALSAELPVQWLSPTETALVGTFSRGPFNVPILVDRAKFQADFAASTGSGSVAEIQVGQFFEQGGTKLFLVRIRTARSLTLPLIGDAENLSGIHALTPLSNLRLILVPELSELPTPEFDEAFAALRAFLVPRGIFLILDPPAGLSSVPQIQNWVGSRVPLDSGFCAIYFPYLRVRFGKADLDIGASGRMAAIYAQSDSELAIWKTPGGTRYPLLVPDVTPVLTSGQADALTAAHINPIRSFPGRGILAFGARVLNRADPEELYISIRRTRDWITASLTRRLSFSATRENAFALRSELRALTEEFFTDLWRSGALVGDRLSDAFFVRCDASTTSETDLAAHRVTVLYGLAFTRPAEFLVRELKLGTLDPSRALPEVRLRLIPAGRELQIAFPLLPGFNYILESRGVLGTENWKVVDGPRAGDGSWLRTAVTPLDAQEYFLVRVVQ